MSPPSPYVPKDFALIKRNGFYHIFYTRKNPLPAAATEVSLGHAVSPDLFNWQELDTVLAVQPDAWDETRIWAPHIVESDGVYYMLYTGVRDQPGAYAMHQRIGIATSVDLMQWNHFVAPVWTCASAPWTQCDSLTAAGGNFRDPFVMPNPSVPGEWLLYFATIPEGFPNDMVIGRAGSADLWNWSDLGAMWNTHRSYTGLGQAESAHLFKHDNSWYMVFTTNASEPLSLSIGTNLDWPAPAWTFRGSIGPIIGQNTAQWFASEHLVDGTHEYFSYVNHNRIEIREMVWEPNGDFTLVVPSFFHVQQMSLDATQVQEGSGVQLEFTATGWSGRWAKIEVVSRDGQGNETPHPASWVNLPDSVRMTAASTVVPWLTTVLTGPNGLPSVSELRVRTQDQTASTGWIRVTPFLQPDPGAGTSVPKGTVRILGGEAVPGTGPRLRALKDSPLGEAPTLLVQLDQPAHVQVELFDVRGRRLRVLCDRELGTGATVVAWDGRDQSHQAAAPGVYFARLRAPHGVAWSRLVLMR